MMTEMESLDTEKSFEIQQARQQVAPKRGGGYAQIHGFELVAQIHWFELVLN